MVAQNQARPRTVRETHRTAARKNTAQLRTPPLHIRTLRWMLCALKCRPLMTSWKCLPRGRPVSCLSSSAEGAPLARTAQKLWTAPPGLARDAGRHCLGRADTGQAALPAQHLSCGARGSTLSCALCSCRLWRCCCQLSPSEHMYQACMTRLCLTGLFGVCCSPGDALDFQPYDLKVYPPDHPVPPRESDYYTVTMTGVVHVCCGEPTELTPLATFVRQRTLFRVLRSIPFYKNFIISRALQRWHKVCRSDGSPWAIRCLLSMEQLERLRPRCLNIELLRLDDEALTAVRMHVCFAPSSCHRGLHLWWQAPAAR